MLVHRDRMDVLLGRYAVGTAHCLTEPGHDVSRVARNPRSPEELGGLAFSAFDVLEIDSHYPTSCAAAWGELQRLGLHVPAHARCNSAEAVRKQFRYWTELGYEGAVL